MNPTPTKSKAAKTAPEPSRNTRKLVVSTFVTLDGVMQAPGAPDEDRDGGFTHGGWLVPYFDDLLAKVMTDQLVWPFDLLLGRKTYRIFESHWPHVKGEPSADNINRATKYIVSHKPQKLEWQGSKLITGDVVGAIKKLKAQDGPVLQVHGSSNLIQTLLKNDLVDELWLKIFPVTIGTGKRLFGDGTVPAAFKVRDTHTSPSGVIVATYAHAGELKTGSVARA